MLLHEADILRSVDAGRYLGGVSRADVERKLGEPIVTSSWEFERRSKLASETQGIRRGVRAYLRAAVELRGAGHWGDMRADELEREARWLTGHLKNITTSSLYGDLRPVGTFLKRKMNRLMIETLAILRHTTSLTTTWTTQFILPSVFEIASDHYGAPELVSPAATWTRYRALAATAKERGFQMDELLYHFRVALFAGDERFPRTLFDSSPTEYSRRK